MRDPDLLSNCLVDGDLSALARSRRKRRQALLVAVLIEVGLLAALLLVPIVSSTVPPRWISLAPTPPFRGNPNPASQPQRGSMLPQPHRDQLPHTDILFHQPIAIPTHVSPAADNSGPPEIAAQTNGAGPFGDPNGLIEGPLSSNSAMRPPLPPPAAHPPTPRPLHRSEGVEQALLLHRVDPVYPEIAKRAHIEGTVRLHALIGTDGAVRDVEILSGHPILAKAARDAVLEWRYRPTLLNGEKVEVETTITVIFELTR